MQLTIYHLTPSLRELKMSVDYGDGTLLDQFCSCTTSPFLQELGIFTRKDRTHADKMPVPHFTTMPTFLIINPQSDKKILKTDSDYGL